MAYFECPPKWCTEALFGFHMAQAAADCCHDRILRVILAGLKM